MRHAIALVFLVVSIVAAAHVRAGPLPTPAGRVLLEVAGAIENTNGDGRAAFDRAMLEAIGLRTFESVTPFTEGSSTWTGVPLEALLDHVGAKGSMVEAKALDYFEVEFDAEELIANGAILALERDGRPMRVRDRGPVWIIFPWSELGVVENSPMRDFAVWQLVELHVK